MSENQQIYIMEDVPSLLKVEYSSNINIRMRNNYSLPNLMSLFPSSHQADILLYCSILWHFPFQSVLQYVVNGLQIFRIHHAMTMMFQKRLIRRLTWLSFFRLSTKLTHHSIVLFYDISQHRAYPYTQSLAFGYSVSARRWQAGSSDDQFATWQDCSLSVCLPNWRSTLLFYSMIFPNTEHIPIRSHWPSATPYPPGDDKQVPATINSPPDRTVLFQSVYQTDDPFYCFILWPFPTQSVFLYAVIGLRLLRIRLAMTSRYWPRSILHQAWLSSFRLPTKLTIHSIVLFYDLSQHRAYSYTQSLAFGYSVSARLWQADTGHD